MIKHENYLKIFKFGKFAKFWKAVSRKLLGLQSPFWSQILANLIYFKNVSMVFVENVLLHGQNGKKPKKMQKFISFWDIQRWSGGRPRSKTWILHLSHIPYKKKKPNLLPPLDATYDVLGYWTTLLWGFIFASLVKPPTSPLAIKCASTESGKITRFHCIPLTIGADFSF